MTEPRTPTGVADLEARWAAVELKLEAHADVLAGQGTLVAKHARGRRVWVVRYVVRVDGRRAHRSVYVGGDDVTELIERVRSLLSFDYPQLARVPCRGPGAIVGPSGRAPSRIAPLG